MLAQDQDLAWPLLAFYTFVLALAHTGKHTTIAHIAIVRYRLLVAEL